MTHQQADYAIEELTADLARLRIGFVNVYLAGAPGSGQPWVLVDAGLAMGAATILRVAAERFGVDSRPAAVVLTHGHFDHVGALAALLAMWDVPVYAHTAEFPFLTGAADYPPPDPTVGGGVLGRHWPLAPDEGIDLGDRVLPLPANHDVPGMPGWQWIHTPGHAPGHVSLFREEDRVLLAGDAIVTTRQESAYAPFALRRELTGPPAYFTIDWERAERSVMTLASLKPAVLATGHGEPMTQPSLPDDLAALARDFNHRSKPSHGRYVNHPADVDAEGVVALPSHPSASRVRWGALSGVAAATFAGTWLYRRFGRRTPTS
jgi:glyoxylase-like metal-dependent hydrolase (beta-lactamase superfamily II)